MAVCGHVDGSSGPGRGAGTLLGPPQCLGRPPDREPSGPVSVAQTDRPRAPGRPQPCVSPIPGAPGAARPLLCPAPPHAPTAAAGTWVWSRSLRAGSRGGSWPTHSSPVRGRMEHVLPLPHPDARRSSISDYLRVLRVSAQLVPGDLWAAALSLHTEQAPGCGPESGAHPGGPSA